MQVFKKGLLNLVFLASLLMIIYINSVFAQCAMCKLSAETSVLEGSDKALTLNLGIIYLFVFPYILIIALYFIYRKYSAKDHG